MTILGGAAFLSVLVTVGIVVSLLLPALDFFQEVSVWEFLTGDRWTPQFSGQESYGVLPLVTGTAWTTAIAMLIAVPFGLGCAI